MTFKWFENDWKTFNDHFGFAQCVMHVLMFAKHASAKSIL